MTPPFWASLAVHFACSPSHRCRCCFASAPGNQSRSKKKSEKITGLGRNPALHLGPEVFHSFTGLKQSWPQAWHSGRQPVQVIWGQGNRSAPGGGSGCRTLSTATWIETRVLKVSKPSKTKNCLNQNIGLGTYINHWYVWIFFRGLPTLMHHDISPSSIYHTILNFELSARASVLQSKSMRPLGFKALGKRATGHFRATCWV